MTNLRNISATTFQKNATTPSKKKDRATPEGNKQRRNATSLTPYGAYIPGMSQVASKENKQNEPLYANIHKNEAENKPSTIGVLDRYVGPKKEIGIKLDIDRTYDLNHGDVVNEYIKNGGKNISTQRIDSRDSAEIMAKRLEAVANKEYMDYDALNISMTQPMKYSDVERLLGIKGVTPETLAEKREEIIEKHKNTEGFENNYKSIKAIEKTVKGGTPVYIAAGNYSDQFNLLTLAKGSVSVGALETEGPDKGKPMNGFSHNTEIDLYYPGKYKVSKIKGSDERLFGNNNKGKLDPNKSYFNIGGGTKAGPQGDGTVLYPEEAASYTLPINFIWGSSFATPNVITEDPEPYKINWDKTDKSKPWKERLNNVHFK